MGEIIIEQNDITKQQVDVIVNAANTRLNGGGGVDGAIHRAAGPSVMEECRKIGGCKTGEAVITGAGDLRAKKIIHTPGPVWQGGTKGEPRLLKSCYERSFILAVKNKAKTIAFSAISTGVYGYPPESAALVALSEGIRWKDSFDTIIYVCFSRDHYEVYTDIYEHLNAGNDQ